MAEDDGHIRESLRQATVALLEAMKGFAEDGRLDKVEELASRIDEISRFRNLPSEIRNAMGAGSDIALSAYRQKITDLLELAAALTAGADAQVKSAILDLIDGILLKAQAVGATSGFVEDVKRRIARYRPSPVAGDAPFEGGRVFSIAKVSRQAFAAETVPDRDWRVRRYNKPPVAVTLLGTVYPTRNWTERGFVLTGFSQLVSSGARLQAILRCDLVPTFQARCWIRVVRHEPDRRLVAAEFEKDSPISQLIEQIAGAALNR